MRKCMNDIQKAKTIAWYQEHVIFGTEYIYIYIKERHYFCMIKLSFQKIAAQKRRELMK